ncbi:hypothetical protein AMTRI_Chr08g205280 [Amborella trichopoda]
MRDFNLALVIVAAVVCVLVFIFNVYLLINYQHPDDVNQAYFPKFIVVWGLSVAGISILMLPTDVANRHACKTSIYHRACNLTIPMKDLWLTIYVVDVILEFFVIPFAMFYYEGDQDKVERGWKQVMSALMWVVVTAIVCGLVLGISMVSLVGREDFTVMHLSSSTTSFPSTWTGLSRSQPCLGASHQCAAYSTTAAAETTWTMRTTFPEYVVALATIVGSVLFTIFGGVGIFCLPLGLIFSFIRRPKAEATELGKKARELKKAAAALHQEEKSGSKGRKWRKNVEAVEKELLLLEEDTKALEEYTLHVLSVMCSVCRSCLCIFFAGRNCLGVNCSQWGGTLMNSFLFNVGLILLCSISVLQFCATAFGYYAQATAAQEIFGHTLKSLCGIKYLYKYNVFQIAFIVFAGLTFIYYALFGWRRRKPTGRFQLSS